MKDFGWIRKKRIIMKNYITIQEIINIYKISQSIVDIILKKYKIDTFKGKKWLLINFKDFHKAYSLAYNPWLFSELDKKVKDISRKPEEVEKLLKFGDIDWLFTKCFSGSYKIPQKKTTIKNKWIFL